MNLQTWCNSKNKDYAEGVKLYEQYHGSDTYLGFFRQEQNPGIDSMHFKMLIRKLNNTLRVALQNGTLKTEAVIETPVANNQPIIVQEVISRRDTTGANPDELRTNQKYINKILALEWKDLDKRDKAVFYNNKRYFAKRKELFIENSNHEKILKSLHEKLKHGNDKTEREKILTQAKNLESIQTKNWQVIDTWDEPKEEDILDPNVVTANDIARKVQRINLLQNYINRAKAAIKRQKLTGDAKTKKELRIHGWQSEMKQLQNEIA